MEDLVTTGQSVALWPTLKTHSESLIKKTHSESLITCPTNREFNVLPCLAWAGSAVWWCPVVHCIRRSGILPFSKFHRIQAFRSRERKREEVRNAFKSFNAGEGKARPRPRPRPRPHTKLGNTRVRRCCLQPLFRSENRCNGQSGLKEVGHTVGIVVILVLDLVK